MHDINFTIYSDSTKRKYFRLLRENNYQLLDKKINQYDIYYKYLKTL
jgi:hypothetical protein